MDIYKNWENGVEDFEEGLELFLKETGMNIELQKILKKEILKQKIMKNGLSLFHNLVGKLIRNRLK